MLLFNSLFVIISLNIFRLKKNKICYVLFVVIFFLLSFIRWNVGTDWESYYLTFMAKNIKDMYMVNEIGYKVLNNIVANLTSSYTVMLFILAVILFSSKYITIWKLSKLPIISLLLCLSFYRGDIYFIRQHIAAAICLFGSYYYLKNKIFKFTVITLCATLIHSSSIIFFIIYFFKDKLGYKKRNYIILMIISIFFIPFMKEFMYFLSKILDGIGVYGYKIKRYLDAGHNMFGATTKNLFHLYFSAISNKLFINIIFIIKLRKLDKKDKMIFDIYYFGTLIYILLFSISSQILRINIFFEMFAIILLANYIKYIKKNKNRIFWLFLIIIYAYLKLLSGLGSQPPGVYLPYKTIFY